MPSPETVTLRDLIPGTYHVYVNAYDSERSVEFRCGVALLLGYLVRSCEWILVVGLSVCASVFRIFLVRPSELVTAWRQYVSDLDIPLMLLPDPFTLFFVQYANVH